MVKFNNKLSDYDYILSFDLAKHKTGWALVGIKESKVFEYGLVVLDEKAESPWTDIYQKFLDVLNYIKNKYKNFFVTKEKLPNQAGRFTTIASLQGLAQVHSVWEICCCLCNIPVYDYDGVHSVSVKALVRNKTGIEKPQKEDVEKYIIEKYYGLENLNSLDVSDAIGVADTLIESKWNLDIRNEIKVLEKKIKEYKAEKKQNELQNRIEKLKNMMV